MSAELSALVALITSQVETISTICSSNNTSIPSIDGLINVAPDVANNPKYVEAADLAIAAATRLIATLRNPQVAIRGVASGMYGSALLNVAVEANITEALNEAGQQGMHVRDLAPKVRMDPVKLARVLRYLCGIHHTYREVSPNVFANNRMSSVLDTGKTFEEVKDRGLTRYDGSKGAAAQLGHITDVVLKGTACLSDVLLDPETAFSLDASKTSVMKAMGYDGGVWEWFEEPEQKKRLNRFGEAMKNLFSKEMIIGRFDWSSLPKGGLVVDIGGGLGGSTLPLAETFSDLRFVIQDRPPVIADAEKHWSTVLPKAIESGLVKLQGHSFFEPQPIKDAAVFLLRFVLHDWPDAEAIKILKLLRDAANPDTKVVIIDQIVPYTCPVEDDPLKRKIPEVLNGNMAAARCMPYHNDIQMLNVVNAQERTIGEWEELIKASELRIEFIKPGPVPAIVCVPI